MFNFDTHKIKIFTDGANLDSIIKLSKDNFIDGITTNPTLMRRSGVTNYMTFAQSAVKASLGKSISLEVFSDDLDEMINQARILSTLGKSVYVKIPVTNSQGKPTTRVIKSLLSENIKVNITAVLSYSQIDHCIDILEKNSIAYISIFAGRIADTGISPCLYLEYALKKLIQNNMNNVELIWASTREVFNIYEAAKIGCHIITVPPEIIKKIRLYNYDLNQLSLETVQMFKSDSDEANYSIGYTQEQKI